MAAVCFLVTGLGSAAPLTTGRQAPAGTGSIAGVVRTADRTGEPVRRARVWILNTLAGDRGIRQVTTTDQEGRFVFSSLPEGRFLVTAEKPAYVGGEAGARTPGGPGVPIAVTAGQTISNVDVRLTPGAVVTGRVMNVHGAPAAGVGVSLSMRRIVDGRSILSSTKTATSNDLGQYRFFGLRPGRYVVVARPPTALGGGTVASPAELQWAQRLSESRASSPPPSARPVAYAAVWYPGVLDTDSAADVAVEAGEERTGIDIPLQFVSVASISGVVMRADGRPAPNARVLIWPATKPTQARTDAAGRFSFANLQPRQYTVVADATDASGAEFAHAAATVAGEDVNNVQLRLQPGGTIAGRLVMDAQTGAAPLSPTRLSLRLQSVGGAPSLLSGLAALEADGRFRWAGVAPGSYRVDVSIASTVAGEDWVVRSATLGGRDVLDAPFTLEPASALADLQVTLTDRVAAITGRLVDQAGRPAPELFVAVFPANPLHWREGSRWMRAPAHPASDGQFVFRGLPAGEYYLAVLARLDDEWRSAAFLEQVIPGALRITLAEGERRTQDIQLSP